MNNTESLQELESLRLQVARLTRELTEQDHALHDLRNILDTVPDFLFTLDHQGRLIKWNKTATEVTGYAPEELLNKPALAFVPAEEQGRTTAAIRQAFTEGYAELDGHLLTKDGRRIPYQWTGAALKNSQGETIGIAGIGRDVSEQKRIEEEHRALFDQSPLMCFLIDTEGTVHKVNHQGAMALGYRAEELLGQSILTVFPEEHRTTARKHIAACVADAGHALTCWESEKQRKDGSRFWVREFARVMTDRYGRPTLLISCEDITARRRAEQALQQSEERFRTFLEHAPSLAFLKATDGTYLYINRQFEAALGIPRAEALGKTDRDLFPLHQAELFQSHDRQVLEQQQAKKFEEVAEQDDGLHTSIVIKFPLRDTSGIITSIGGIATDITERTQAEVKIHKQAELLDRIFEHSLDCIVLLDKDYNFIRVNQAYARVCQRDVSDFLGHNHFNDYPSPLKDEFDEAIRKGIPYSRTARPFTFLDHPEWGVTYWDLEMVPIHGASADIDFLLFTLKDVTERKRAEDALRENEQLFRTLAQVSPVGIFRADTNGQYLYVNERWCAMAGMSPHTAAGTGWTAALHPDDRERVAMEWTQAAKIRQPFSSEYRFQRGDQQITWVVGQAQAELGEHGDVVGYVGTITDITDRKHMEEALCHRERDLRRAIDERERISQDLHDGILQSLYAIGLGLESCKPLMHQRKHKQVSELLEQAIGPMNRVMGEIRNFIAGLDSGMLSGDTFSGALHAVIQTVTTTQPLQCTVTIDDAAASQLSTEQILHLMNIAREALSNSLRHGHATEATVSFKQLAHSLRLCISDNGQGFNPSSVQGVGHGLANMAARAHKIRGQFAIRSAHQRGTRVIVDLPQKAAYANTSITNGSVAARRRS